MQNDNINPIHHGAFSKATGTVTGAAGGAIGTAGKAVGSTLLFSTLAGAGIAVAIGLTGGLAAGGFLTTMLFNAVIGSLSGAVVGMVASPVVGGIGAWVGAVKGGSNAATRIRNEQGAANMVDAQLSAYQAQAYAASAAPTTVYAPSAANNNYPTASTMNQAGTKVQADSAMDLGTINGQQLAAAR